MYSVIACSTFRQLREAAEQNGQSISGEARYRLRSSFREEPKVLPIDRAITLFTFTVHLALPPLIRQGRPIGTGVARGLLGIPPLELGDFALVSQNKIAWFYVTLCVAAVAIYIVYFIILPGRWGKAFVAMRDSEDFAKSLGINYYKYKLSYGTSQCVRRQDAKG